MHVMLKTATAAVLGILMFCIASCGHPAKQAATTDYSKFVRVATVEGQFGDRVERVLKRADIPHWLLGAESYVILVSPDAQSRAASLLRADAEAHKYQLVFP